MATWNIGKDGTTQSRYSQVGGSGAHPGRPPARMRPLSLEPPPCPSPPATPPAAPIPPDTTVSRYVGAMQEIRTRVTSGAQWSKCRAWPSGMDGFAFSGSDSRGQVLFCSIAAHCRFSGSGLVLQHCRTLQRPANRLPELFEAAKVSSGCPARLFFPTAGQSRKMLQYKT
jgi:hypothetical protein